MPGLFSCASFSTLTWINANDVRTIYPEAKELSMGMRARAIALSLAENEFTCVGT
jgi:hypothetical protein